MDTYPLQRRKVVVPLDNGLHLRPISLIAKAVGAFSGEVWIRREDGYAVNAKRMIDLMTLEARKGTALMLEAQGEGAAELLDQLEALFDDNFGVLDEEEELPSARKSPSSQLRNTYTPSAEPE